MNNRGVGNVTSCRYTNTPLRVRASIAMSLYKDGIKSQRLQTVTSI